VNPSTSIPITNPTLASVSNLSTTTTNLLSALLNATRSNGIETTNGMTIIFIFLLNSYHFLFLVPPPTNPIVNPVPNLPLNFNIPPPNHFSINQLLVNVLSLGIPPRATFSKYSFFCL